MKFDVDMSLFEGVSHSPSFLSLQNSLGSAGHQLRDFCVPVNPYFPPAGLMDTLKDQLSTVLKYYPEQNEAIASNLCQSLGLPPESVVVANGSTELISWINVLFVPDSLATPIPTFGRWTDLPVETGKKVFTYLRKEEDNFQLDLDGFVESVRKNGTRVVAICNPNNPTGALLSREEVLSLIESLSDLDMIVIDESFLDFCEQRVETTIADDVIHMKNVILLKSLGKNFGLHGLRMGYAVTHPETAARLRAYIPKWNLNGIAELLLKEILNEAASYEQSLNKVISDRTKMVSLLSQVDEIKLFPTQANFVYLRLIDDVNGLDLRNRLMKNHGLLVRECGNKLGASSQYFRIATRPEQEIATLVAAMKQELYKAKLQNTVPMGQEVSQAI